MNDFHENLYDYRGCGSHFNVVKQAKMVKKKVWIRSVYYVSNCTICNEVFLQIQYGSFAHYAASLIVAARISYKRDGPNRYLQCSGTANALQQNAVTRTKLPVVRSNWASGGEIEEANELQRNVSDYSSTKTFSFPCINMFTIFHLVAATSAY